MKSVVVKILVTGAGGFIGRHIVGQLLAAGFPVTVAGRNTRRLGRIWPEATALACDFSQDDASVWSERLVGTDCVVNCAGLLGDRADYAGVHDRGARALFDGCLAAGVGRVIQMSALGAGAGSVTPYHRSKHAADAHLAALDPAGTRLGWAILRPSLVLGQGGASTALFTGLAALPATPRLGGGQWQVQPIHVDDLVTAVLCLIRRPAPLALHLDAVGPEPMTTDQLTASLRRWLGLVLAPRLPLPRGLLSLAARLGIGPATRESLTMLTAGNTASVTPFVEALGFRPMRIDHALARHPACMGDIVDARFWSIAPLLRFLLALVWLAGGIVSLAFAPPDVLGEWLAKIGLTGAPATAALWLGSLADIAVGLALLLRVPKAALAGILLMAAYTAILTVAAPAIWADPFGSVVKNAAVLGLSLAVQVMEIRRG